jgi:hypothetical protein
VTGAIIGAGGGVALAVATHSSVLEAVGIGLGIAVVGAVLAPIVVYLASSVTAGGRIIREELGAMRSELQAHGKEHQSPATLEREAPGSGNAPFVVPLQRQLDLGQILLRRCPKPTFGRVVPPPREVALDVEQWIARTEELLAQWPDFAHQFAGEIATTDDNPLPTPHPLTKQLETRLQILRGIIASLRAA